MEVLTTDTPIRPEPISPRNTLMSTPGWLGRVRRQQLGGGLRRVGRMALCMRLTVRVAQLRDRVHLPNAKRML
jgi:hypothetical protein